MDFSSLLGLKAQIDTFKYNHPKIAEFTQNIRNQGFCENQEIAIAVRYPDGTEFKTGIRVQSSDIEFLKTLSQLSKTAGPF